MKHCEHCESNSERLSALADGELGRFEAWRLRSHVVRCEVCARTLAEWRNVNALLETVEPVPGAAFSASPARRIPWTRLAPRLAAAALSAAVAAGLFYSEPQNHDSPMAAHASMVRAMSDVRTATWQADTTIFTEKSGKVYCKMQQINKARLDPPSLLWSTQTLYKSQAKAFGWDSGCVRLDMQSWTNYSSGLSPGSLSVDHQIKKYLAKPLNARETLYQRVRRDVFDAIFKIISPDARKRSRSPQKQDADGFTRKTVSPMTSVLVIRNGRREFRISEATCLLPGYYEFRNTVWADAQSFWIDEAENSVIDLRTGRTNVYTHLSHFQYNRPLTDADMTIHTAPGTLLFSDGKRVKSLP